MTSAERVAVVGTGLIGTSIAMASVRAGETVRGFDADPDALARAAERSGLTPSATLEESVAGATLVFVCTPIPELPGLVSEILRLAPDAIVTDVGSVKTRVMSGVDTTADPAHLDRFIGGHPMGGSERSGPDYASASVLDGVVWVLSPAPGVPEATVARLATWVEKIGARPVPMDPERHDRLVAVVSHLPQVASTALMGLAAAEEAGEPEILLLAAGGFRDLTRLAASSPHLWSDILLANGDAIARAIDLYVGRLTRLRNLIRRAEAAEVERAFGEAKRARLSLAAKPQVKAGVAVLQVPVPDRPGVLAEVTATMSDAGVNIEDLQIVHSAEGGRGQVQLTVASDAAEEAADVLAAAGYDPARSA